MVTQNGEFKKLKVYLDMRQGSTALAPHNYKIVQKVNSFLLNVDGASASKFLGANKLDIRSINP